MDKNSNYDDAVQIIKAAIISSQYDAVKILNEKQLMLYFGIGKYISLNSRNGAWGESAIDTISEKLVKELPGLRRFSARNLRNMRFFYEEWLGLDTNDEKDNLAVITVKLDDNYSNNTIWQLQLPKDENFPIKEFFSIGFTNHIMILSKVKNLDERKYYIIKWAEEHLTVDELKNSIELSDYKHQGKATNNFKKTLQKSNNMFKAISTFKDEYLLDYINVEELNIRDKQDIDEKVIENAIIHNIKNFILTFGKGFSFEFTLKRNITIVRGKIGTSWCKIWKDVKC